MCTEILISNLITRLPQGRTQGLRSYLKYFSFLQREGVNIVLTELNYVIILFFFFASFCSLALCGNVNTHYNLLGILLILLICNLCLLNSHIKLMIWSVCYRVHIIMRKDLFIFSPHPLSYSWRN